MKRLKAILLVLLYCSASAGTVMELHYCEGGWMSSVMSAPKMACCQGKMGTHNRGCCQHPKIQMKLSRDQQITVLCDFKAPIPTHLLSYFTPFFTRSTRLSHSAWKASSSHSPPFLLQVPSYITYSDFRI